MSLDSSESVLNALKDFAFIRVQSVSICGSTSSLGVLLKVGGATHTAERPTFKGTDGPGEPSHVARPPTSCTRVPLDFNEFSAKIQLSSKMIKVAVVVRVQLPLPDR